LLRDLLDGRTNHALVRWAIPILQPVVFLVLVNVLLYPLIWLKLEVRMDWRPVSGILARRSGAEGSCMRSLRFILVFAISWSLAVLPLAGSMAMAEADHTAMPGASNMTMAEAGNMSMPDAGHMAMADSTRGASEFTIGPAHECCDKDQAPADHMKNCQAAAACAKCFNFFDALLSAPITHPPLIKAEAWITIPAVFSSPHHLPFRPPRT
jgi:hypothetical protein